MSGRWRLSLQAINDQRAEWRLNSVDLVFVKEDTINDLEPARIGEVLEAMKRIEIR